MELTSKIISLIYKAVKHYLIDLQKRSLTYQQQNIDNINEEAAEQTAILATEIQEYSTLLKDLEFMRGFSSTTLRD